MGRDWGAYASGTMHGRVLQARRGVWRALEVAYGRLRVVYIGAPVCTGLHATTQTIGRARTPREVRSALQAHTPGSRRCVARSRHRVRDTEKCPGAACAGLSAVDGCTSSIVGGAGGSCARGTRRRRAVRAMDTVVSPVMYVPRIPPLNAAFAMHLLSTALAHRRRTRASLDTTPAPRAATPRSSRGSVHGRLL